jgi:hypothetical protein
MNQKTADLAVEALRFNLKVVGLLGHMEPGPYNLLTKTFIDASLEITEPCTWKEIKGHTYREWITSCSHRYIVELGGIYPVAYNFCPYCGKNMAET